MKALLHLAICGYLLLGVLGCESRNQPGETEVIAPADYVVCLRPTLGGFEAFCTDDPKAVKRLALSVLSDFKNEGPPKNESRSSALDYELVFVNSATKEVVASYRIGGNLIRRYDTGRHRVTRTVVAIEKSMASGNMRPISRQELQRTMPYVVKKLPPARAWDPAFMELPRTASE